MKNFVIGIIVILLLSAILGSCSNNSSRNSYSGYSDTYKTDGTYRKNIKNISDVYGVSEKEVDAKINAVTGGR